MNYYLFLQKFLLKTKTYNSLATVVAQRTAKTTNSKKVKNLLFVTYIFPMNKVSHVIHM